MKSIGKVLGLFVLAVLLIVVALLFALTHLFNPNDYKDEIRQLAREKANLELNLKGDIGWSLFPWLGLELTDATLASADTPEQPFADLRQLGLSVRVLPLLRKEVQMSDIRIDGLNLNLQRDATGHSNWQGIGRPAVRTEVAAEKSTDKSDATPETTQAPSNQGMKLDIDSLTLSNARVIYHDAQSDQQYTLEGIELKTGAIAAEKNIAVKLSAFFGTNDPVLRARSELAGQLRFDQALSLFQFEDITLNGEVSGAPLAGKTLSFNAQGQLLVDLKQHIAELNGLKLSANQLRLLGEFKAADLDKQATFSGALSIAPLNLREFVEGVGVSLPPMQDSKSLSQFELASHISGSTQGLMLEQMTLKLDGSTFTGSFGVRDFARRALRADIKGDSFQLDHYLTAKSKDAASQRSAEVKDSLAKAGTAGTTSLPNAPTQHAWSTQPLLPLESLRKLNLDLSLTLGQFTYAQFPLSDVALKTTARNGLITLSQARGKLHNGSFSSQGSLDVSAPEPLLTLQQHLTRLPIEPLLKQDEIKAPIRGDLTLEANLSARGNSEKTLIDSLNGTATFSLTDGVLLDANIEQQLCRGIATLNRKTLSNPPAGKDTPFRELTGSLTIGNGVAHNPNFIAALPGLTLKGHGDLDLRVLGVDYHLGIILEGDQRAMPDAACKINERYAGIEWPLRCRGPLELGAKACRLDQDGLGQIAARLAGEKLTDKLEEKLGDKVSPELKDALKNLFKR